MAERGERQRADETEVEGLRRRLLDLEAQTATTVARLVGELQQLETLYREAPIGLCFIDTELRWRRINERLASFHGRPVHEHIGARVDELMPELAEHVLPMLRRVIETGRPAVGVEYRARLRSDLLREHDFRSHNHPVLGTDGRVVGVMSVVEDITEQKRVEAELRKTHERYARTERLARTVSWEWDIAEDEVWWSPEGLRRFVPDPQAPLDSVYDVLEMVHIEDRRIVREAIEATLDNGRPYQVCVRVVLPTGEVRTVVSRAEVERGSGGEPVRMIGSSRDVTEELAGAEREAS